MALEKKVTRSLSISGGGMTLGGVAQTLTPDSDSSFQKELPANEVDLVIETPDLILANVSVMAIVANQDCVVKTNSASTPTDTLNLKANKMLNWMTGDPAANKFLTADVTGWFVTTGETKTTLKIFIGMDSTPGITG